MVTFAEKKKKAATVDAKRNADVMKVLKGDFDNVPCEPSTAVRLYLCANSLGKDKILINYNIQITYFMSEEGATNNTMQI